MTVKTPHRFPHDPALVGLIHAARNRSDSGALIYDTCGHEKSLPQLIGDVIKTSQVLCTRLPPAAFDARGVLRQETPYVSVLTCSGYDFLVAFFAIRAVGGACVPLGTCCEKPANQHTPTNLFNRLTH
jgi:malonyl-CoA/methylmalonyl-CoA synthetase